MRCPFCSHGEDKVVDSRSSKEGQAVAGRECLDADRDSQPMNTLKMYRLLLLKTINAVSLMTVRNSCRVSLRHVKRDW